MIDELMTPIFEGVWEVLVPQETALHRIIDVSVSVAQTMSLAVSTQIVNVPVSRLTLKVVEAVSNNYHVERIAWFCKHRGGDAERSGGTHFGVHR